MVYQNLRFAGQSAKKSKNDISGLRMTWINKFFKKNIFGIAKQTNKNKQTKQTNKQKNKKQSQIVPGQHPL